MKNISIKALIIGIISIVIMGLTFQLAFLLLATAYTNLLKLYPDFVGIGNMLSYTAGIVAYLFIMSLGGYITSHLAQNRIYLHCLLVSSTVVGFSLISSVRSDNFTYISALFAISGLAFTLLGGGLWIKHFNDKPH